MIKYKTSEISRLILKFITYNVYVDRDQTDVVFLVSLFQNNYIYLKVEKLKKNIKNLITIKNQLISLFKFIADVIQLQ